MRTVQAMAMLVVLVAGCSGDDDEPLEEGITFRETMEEYSTVICQRGLDCGCGPVSDYEACRQEWIDSLCELIEADGGSCDDINDLVRGDDNPAPPPTPDEVRENLDTCIEDTTGIACDSTELPRSCSSVIPYDWELVCPGQE